MYYNHNFIPGQVVRLFYAALVKNKVQELSANVAQRSKEIKC